MNMRILVAEDHDGSRMMLEAAVKQLGHDCVPAKDGAEAWRLFQDAKADVVISARSMPVMDGFELCRRIRSLTGNRYSYFIFLTSLSDKSCIGDGLGVGADDYLGKPLDLDEMSTRLSVAERLTDLHRRLEARHSKLELLIESCLLRRGSTRSLSWRAAASSPRTSRAIRGALLRRDVRYRLFQALQ
jgi:DNA-binding response OmpR family regulator